MTVILVDQTQFFTLPETSSNNVATSPLKINGRKITCPCGMAYFQWVNSLLFNEAFFAREVGRHFFNLENGEA